MATRTCSTSPMPYSRKYVPSVMSRTRRPSIGSLGSGGYGTSSSLYDRAGRTTATATTTSRYQSPSRGSTYEPSRYISSTSTTSKYGVPTTSHRPLPSGGSGPFDERGRKIDIQDALSRTRIGRSESVGGARPLKATHVTSPRRYSPADLTTTITSKPPTSLTKRTSSISNLTVDLDNMHVNNTSTTPLGRRGRAGSHTDLSGGNTARTPDSDLYDTGSSRMTLTKNYYNTGSHSYDYNKDTENGSNDSVLPSIKKTSSITSRSPSQDRLRDDDTRGTTRRSLITNGTRSNNLDRHNSRTSPEASSSAGLVGMKNLGNTCFMSSILQCLSHTRLLREYCLSDEYKDDVNRTTSLKGALINAYAKVIKSLWKSGADSYLSPTEFKSQIAKFAPRFVGYNQQDSQEFLIYLLEGLHEDVNRVTAKKKPIITDDEGEEKISASEKATQMWKRYLDRDNSKIVDLFVGQLKSALKCTTCGYTSNTFDPFWDLSLPIKKKRGGEVTLSDCFELFTQEEALDGDEKPTCARCKTRRKCTKSLSIQRFPKILIIHLKRFNPESFVRAKLSTLVDFPLKDLDLSKFAAEKSQAPVLYNLYAVSNHSGTTFSGHYTAYCKGSKSNDWNYFNDTRVSSITSNHIRSSEAYVLFYELSNGSHPARL